MKTLYEGVPLTFGLFLFGSFHDFGKVWGGVYDDLSFPFDDDGYARRKF